MKPIPLFGLSQSGKSRSVTSQGHVNLYAEIIEDAEKSKVVYYNTPGLTLFTSFGDTPVRGWIAVDNYFYAVHRGIFWKVDNSGVKTNLGALTTSSGRVSLSYSGTQIAIADGSNLYCYTLLTTAFVTVGSGLYPNPSDVTYQDSYFIVTFGNGVYQISASYDGTTFDALDFASAESNPDGILRVIADHGEIVLCGENTIEYSSNTGAQDFPYATLKGATQEFGLAAKWSLTKYNDSLAGLFINRMGQVQIMMMLGHTLKEISTPELSSLINNYSSFSDATAYSYMLGSHPMYVINFPTAGKTWMYDSTTNLWASLQSGLNGDRYAGEMCLNFLTNRLIADYASGNIYRLAEGVYTDNGMQRPVEITSRHIHNVGNRISISMLQVLFEPGAGLVIGQGEDPQVSMSISKDGGFTYGNEIFRSIGQIGQYLYRSIWYRLGQARDWVFRFRITDPIKVVIIGATVESPQ